VELAHALAKQDGCQLEMISATPARPDSMVPLAFLALAADLMELVMMALTELENANAMLDGRAQMEASATYVKRPFWAPTVKIASMESILTASWPLHAQVTAVEMASATFDQVIPTQITLYPWNTFKTSMLSFFLFSTRQLHM